MGAQVSVSRSDVMNKVLQAQVQEGGSVTCQNVTGDIKLVFDKTTGRNILITQQCTTDAQQVYNGLVKELSEAIQRNSAATEGGLGIGIGVATSRAENMVEQIQQQNCGVSNVSNIMGNIELDATGSDLQDVRFEQIGNASQNCVFGAVADAIAKIESETEAKTKGWQIFGGNFGIILGIIIAVVVAGFILRTLAGKDEETKLNPELNKELLRRMNEAQKGGAGGGVMLSLVFLIAIVLLICGCS